MWKIWLEEFSFLIFHPGEKYVKFISGRKTFFLYALLYVQFFQHFLMNIVKNIFRIAVLPM